MSSTATDTPTCAAARPVSSPPRARLPSGSCDTHFHVFGPSARYPLDPRRSYTPHVSTLDDYRAVMRACGIDRAVLVQPSVYGNDNTCLLDALRAGGGAFRGVAVPAANASDDELAAMHALGVRGVRLNLVNPQVLGVAEGIALCERMAGRGWHLQLHVEMGKPESAGLVERLVATTRLTIVVDHMGRPVDGKAPGRLLDLLASGRVWVKLSAAYRVSHEGGPGYADVLPIVRSLCAANPERLVWGSDWPHVELAARMPDDADLVDLLAEWFPDPDTRRRVCVDNPARLYGFAPDVSPA
ncbi:MAG: amidohydrolase family protein [Caldimonas sp.]